MREKEFHTASGGLAANDAWREVRVPPADRVGGRTPEIPGRMTTQVRVPPVDSWAYAACYWPLALTNLMRRHRLQAQVQPVFAAPFDPRPGDARRWCEALGLDEPAAARAPFMFAQAVGTVLYMRLFASLGLNFRHLLHLDHASWLGAVAEGRQTVSCELVDVVALGAGKVVLSVASDVRAADGCSTLKVRDRFIVRGYSAAQLAHLPLDAELAQSARQQARRKPVLDTARAQVLPVPIAIDAGRRFARVAGDANPVHTTRLGARLFGFPGPFLQGLATRNLVVGHLAAIGVDVRQVELRLCRPVFCGQTARLVRDGAQVELLDRHGHLLAAGTVGSAPA